MPRYFFDTDDGSRAIRDDEGMEYPDPEAARRAALDTLPDMARDVIPDGDHRDFTVRLRDESGKELYEAHLTLTGRWQSAGRT